MAKLNELLVAGPARFLETIQGTVANANKLDTDAGSSTMPVYFSSGVPIAIDCLAVSRGGTGAKSLTSGAALIGNGTGAIQTRSIVDSSSASAIGTSTSLTTERDIYYGLPTINGSHGYTSSTTLFAPTSAGTSGYILKSNGSGAPVWGAQSGIAAGTANKLANLYTSRPASANLTTDGSGGIVGFKATSSMTTGKPMNDAHILHFFWDNTGGYDAQFCLPTNSNYAAQWRNMNGGTWSDWKTLLDSSNYTSYAAKSTHKHTVSHTPAGSIGSTSITPAGSVTSSFTGSSATTGSPSGTTSVYSITGVGSVPSLTASVANRCLTLTFSAGSVPTRSSVTLPSTAHTHAVTAKGSVSSTFTGTAASHNHTFTGTAATITSSTPTA